MLLHLLGSQLSIDNRGCSAGRGRLQGEGILFVFKYFTPQKDAEV